MTSSPPLTTAISNKDAIQWPNVLAWLAAVHAAGLKPYITFTAAPSAYHTSFPLNPTAAQYTTAVTPLVKALIALGVHYFAPWNEPNSTNPHDPNRTPDEGLAAAYWAGLQSVVQSACPATGRNRCYVSAGEFSNFTPTYVKAYANALRSDIKSRLDGVSTPPSLWTMHDYYDVTYAYKPGGIQQESGSTVYENPNAAKFVGELGEPWRAASSRVARRAGHQTTDSSERRR